MSRRRTGSGRMRIDQIVDETRERPKDVAEFADHICRVKHGDLLLRVGSAWHKEIYRRIVDLGSGRVLGVPLEETLAKMRAIADAGSA